MKFAFLFFLAFLITRIGYSQSQTDRIDSLKSVLHHATTDSSKSDLSLEIGYAYTIGNNWDSTEKYLSIAFHLAELSGYELGKANALYELSRLDLMGHGSRDQATLHVLKSLEIYTNLNNNPGIAVCNLQLGVLSYDLKNYSEAVKFFHNTIDLDAKNTAQVTIANYLLALCYSELGKFAKAQALFELVEEENDSENYFFELQIKSFRGKMYSNKGDYHLAIEHLLKIIDKFQSLVDSDDLAPTYTFLSTAYLKNKDYKNTIKYGELAYKFLSKKDELIIYLREVEENLLHAYIKTGNNDRAYFFLNDLSTIRDSVHGNNVLQVVAELKGKFEFEQQMNRQKVEQELKDALQATELEKQKLLRNLFIAGFILLLIFAIVFAYQRNRVSKEKQKSDALLLNILPEEIAEELKAKGKADARDFDTVSILFTDFKEFTQTSEQLSAHDLVAEINTCFEAFDIICSKHKVEKIKTIGDAYMAAGGLPVPTDDSVKNTILTALEMQEFISKRKKENDAQGKPAFEMRVGIHTGAVVAGIVGVKKFQYDIWGDTVNTASRIESEGEVGKVNISQSTYDLLKGDLQFTFEARGKITAKGKGEMEMYFVSRSLGEG